MTINQSNGGITGSNQTRLYRIGGVSALICAGTYLVALGIYMPAYAVGPPPASVAEWFSLFQAKPLTGLFFLGLADILITVLWGPMVLALYAVLKQSNQTRTMIASAFVLVGMALFLATNTAFAMLFLSREYAAAATEAQRSMLLAAGQAMIAITEGARMLPLNHIGAFLLSTVMLSSTVFSKAVAWIGMAGFACLAASSVLAGYATTGPMTAAMIVIVAISYVGAGLLSFLWYILIGVRLLKF